MPVTEATTVRLVLLHPVKLKIRGTVTGIIYIFSGAGYELDVDKRDAEEFLSRPGRMSCCTGQRESPYFSLVT